MFLYIAGLPTDLPTFIKVHLLTCSNHMSCLFLCIWYMVHASLKRQSSNQLMLTCKHVIYKVLRCTGNLNSFRFGCFKWLSCQMTCCLSKPKANSRPAQTKPLAQNLNLTAGHPCRNQTPSPCLPLPVSLMFPMKPQCRTQAGNQPYL